MNLLNHKLFWFRGLAGFLSFPENPLCSSYTTFLAVSPRKDFPGQILLPGINISLMHEIYFWHVNMTHTWKGKRSFTHSFKILAHFKAASSVCIKRKTYLCNCLGSFYLITLYSVKGVWGQYMYATQSRWCQVIKIGFKNTTHFQGWICCCKFSPGDTDDRISTLYKM